MQTLSCHFLIKQFQMGGTISLWYLYPYIYWYFLISSYYLTVSNWHSLTTMKMRRCHFLVKQFQMGGPSAFGIYMFSLQWYFLISSYYLTVSNGGSLTALKSVEVTLSSGSFRWGVHLPLVSTCFLYVLVFPYIFLLFDCFKWVLIDCIEKRRGHSELWQFHMGGRTVCLWYLYPYIYWYFLIFSNKLTAFGVYMFSLHWYFLISSYYLTVSNGRSLTALKSVEVTQSSDSFIQGGTICLWYLYPYIYWYFLIFSNKLTAFGIYMFSLHWYFLVSSYYLTVSNGHSLTALKSIEVTQSSDSFIQGGPPWTH